MDNTNKLQSITGKGTGIEQFSLFIFIVMLLHFTKIILCFFYSYAKQQTKIARAANYQRTVRYTDSYRLLSCVAKDFSTNQVRASAASDRDMVLGAESTQ